MALVPTSTTESQEALQKPLAETPANEPQAMDELPLKKFMEARAPQEADWKERRDNPEPRKKLGGFQRKLLKERERANAAEARAAELEARLNGNHSDTADTAAGQQTSTAPVDANAPRETAPATEGPRQTARAYERNFEEAARHFPDFDQVIAQADANGFQVAEDVEAAIKSSGHPAAIAYAIAKSPETQRLLTEEPHKAVEHVQEIARRISGIHAAPQDPEAARLQGLIQSHNSRVAAAMGEEAKSIQASASAMKITQAAARAVLEQDNSHEVAIYLARNPAVLQDLNQLPPLAAAAKIGRIAGQLESKNTERPKQRVEPPPPIRPVGGGSARSSVELGEMKLSDYMRVRAVQEREYKRRVR